MDVDCIATGRYGVLAPRGSLPLREEVGCYGYIRGVEDLVRVKRCLRAGSCGSDAQSQQRSRFPRTRPFDDRGVIF